MKFDINEVDSGINYPVLRIVYRKKIPEDLMFDLNKALNEAGFNVDMLGGGEYSDGDVYFVGNTDFIIDSADNFDMEFCKEIVDSLVKVPHEVQIYENDPNYKFFGR